MDRVLRRRAPDRRFSEMPASGAVNLGGHLEPAAFSMIERGYDRSVILRHDILPEITLQLLQVTEVKTLLSGLDVPPDEFRQKAEELFGKYRPAVAATGSQIGSVAELVVRAGEAALVSGHRAIGAEDVFLASLASAHPAIERLVAAFALGPSTLGQAPSFEGGDDEARVG